MRTRLLRAVKVTLALVAVVFIGIQFVRPSRTNPISDPAAALGARAPVPADVAAILDRSCRDCHSNDTRWPLYSNVAPMSWLVADHVNHGRSHFNYSEWASYDAARRAQLLKNSCTLGREGAMPMPSYLLLHPNARLSPADIDVLCAFGQQLAASH